MSKQQEPSLVLIFSCLCYSTFQIQKALPSPLSLSDIVVEYVQDLIAMNWLLAFVGL
jgi:hypothetical protein